MEEITKNYFIEASLERVWRALVDQQDMENWGAGPVEMAPKKDFEFSLWGGDVYGKNVSVISKKKIVQEWYGGNWLKPSNVTVELEEKNGGVEINIYHEDVPSEDLLRIEKIWDDDYLGAIKAYLEKKEEEV